MFERLFVTDPSIGVSDIQRPFVKVQSEIPDVVYIKEGEPLIFPCRVTHPDAKVSLVKVRLSTLSQADIFFPLYFDCPIYLIASYKFVFCCVWLSSPTF